MPSISKRTLNVLGDDLQSLAEEAPVFASRERFSFTVEASQDRAKLRRTIDRFLKEPGKRSLIVISDTLTNAGDARGLVPNEFTKETRSKFLDSPHLCGLVAIAPGATRRILDIDRAVDSHALDGESLRRALLKTANGLRLKAPPRRDQVLADNDAVKIQLVQSQEQLHECLRLRFKIYDLMGYLEDAVSRNPAEIEIDCFDLNAVHFVAVDHRSGRVAGTTRLIVPHVSHQIGTLIADPEETVRRQRAWLEAIVDAHGDEMLREKLHNPVFLPLPILQSSDFLDRWREILTEANRGGEISRVVVSPEYRGTGVSSLLMRTAIATAYSIRKPFLLLECAPTHERMYAKYGFERLEGHHCRVQELDQVAVGMRLELREEPDNRAFWFAQRDMHMIRTGKDDEEMLAGTKHLCLCRNRFCWSQADYRFRTHGTCPLRAEHLS